MRHQADPTCSSQNTVNRAGMQRLINQRDSRDKVTAVTACHVMPGWSGRREAGCIPSALAR